MSSGIGEHGLYYWIEKIEAVLKAAEADGIEVIVAPPEDDMDDWGRLHAYVSGQSWLNQEVSW